MVRKASAETSSLMITTIPITKARNNLGALIQQVHLNKEYVILEKDGIPMAGIMDIDEFGDYLKLQIRRSARIFARVSRNTKLGRVVPRRSF